MARAMASGIGKKTRGWEASCRHVGTAPTDTFIRVEAPQGPLYGFVNGDFSGESTGGKELHARFGSPESSTFSISIRASKPVPPYYGYPRLQVELSPQGFAATRCEPDLDRIGGPLVIP